MTLTHAARDWAQSLLGSRVVCARPLTGGVASRMLLVRTEDGGEAVLRQLVSEPYRRHAEGLLTRERDVHGLLAGSGLPVPRTLGLDASGELAGDPSLLMTRLPGSIDLTRSGPERVAALAETLVRLHRVRPAAGDWPRPYQSWATEAKQRVPAWSRDDGLYEEAFDRLRCPAPSYDATFLHRDFHPGNVLWDGAAGGDRVSGLVDWVETSTGPADLDVAHCMSNLAGLHGVETAVSFRRAYLERGGRLAGDPDAAAYWQVLDLVGFLPDGAGRESGAAAEVVAAVWAAHGRRDLDQATVRRRREDLLHAVLRR